MSAQPKVLIADKMSPEAASILSDRGVDVEVSTGLAPEALIELIGGYDGLLVRSSTKVTAEVLGAADRLKVIGRAGIGVDNVDVAAATAKGVVVMNTPFGNAVTTAEHAVAMMMTLARQIPTADRSMRAGKWEKSKFVGVELAGKTLGLVGCGNIGSIVASRAQGLRMRVIVADPFLSAKRARELGVERVELADLMRRADFISAHAPLNDTTRGIVGAAEIAVARDGVRIINCARGGIVDETALHDGLVSGKVAGAALDVFSVEPPQDNPLTILDNVVMTPHLGASTAEAQEKVAQQVAEQAADFLLSGAVSNAINMPSITAEEAPLLQPYMALADYLGSFAGQLTRSGITAVGIEYEGHVADLNTRPLTAVVLAGLMRPMVDSVNAVNAPVVAQQRNIAVSETRHDRRGDYPTCMRVTVTTDRRSREVAGTLFADDRARIVSIKGIRMDAEPTPHMLYIANSDVPGIIGFLGNTLGEAGVNIATFALGRAEAGGDAIALISIDQALDAATLAAIRAHEGISQAASLRFDTD
ncbi:MAG: phosphoglycerate dehydrogenase [Rhodospirillaceae bacterium]|nr:phosphoglycerate dehydrogenase [Rhodospirillaceae bacterium]